MAHGVVGLLDEVGCVGAGSAVAHNHTIAHEHTVAVDDAVAIEHAVAVDHAVAIDHAVAVDQAAIGQRTRLVQHMAKQTGRTGVRRRAEGIGVDVGPGNDTNRRNDHVGPTSVRTMRVGRRAKRTKQLLRRKREVLGDAGLALDDDKVGDDRGAIRDTEKGLLLGVVETEWGNQSRATEGGWSHLDGKQLA